MSLLSALIQGQHIQEPATATRAIFATKTKESIETVAELATVAVAEPTRQLPLWCSKSCACLEEINLPEGKVMGCIQDHPDWKYVWTRLDVMKSCPSRNQKT